MRTPPWLNDSHPEYWYPVAIAARFYFKKHPETIRRMARNGDLESSGIATYFDGTRWYVRVQLEPAQTPKPPHITKD